jgi:DNA repair protein RecN (Recombination protein N)
MLVELRVENLLLIERAELRLGPGLNVITGETGAGKTMLAQALDLLLGGKARAGIVRPGAAEAWVEGVFDLTAELRTELGDRLAADADELVLARRVGADGRTRAYLGGRTATLGDLRELGAGLLAFYGQHEHRKLALASAQLEVLDGFCGPEQWQRRGNYEAAWAEAREARSEIATLREATAGRARELDLLSFELDEIEAADPSEEEHAALLAERERLRHLEALRTAAYAGVGAVAGDGETGGAAPGLAEGVRALENVAGVDPALDAVAERLRAVLFEAQDLAGELLGYTESVEAAPGRLEEVEERLELLGRLERKHGGAIASVLAHAEACRVRRAALAHAEEASEEATHRLAAAEERLAELAMALGDARRAAAPALSAGVRERLAELAMEGAVFDVELTLRDESGPTGAETVEFLIAPNPGVPAGPLREIASGGETSRVMLALMAVAHGGEPGEPGDSGDGRLLVFDEVDAGIGGVTARAVGAQLRSLAEGRQVLCITHLPQIASVADRHFRIAKDVTGDTARTTVAGLHGDELVGEIVRMLGADDADGAAREHARTLLAAA